MLLSHGDECEDKSQVKILRPIVFIMPDPGRTLPVYSWCAKEIELHNIQLKQIPPSPPGSQVNNFNYFYIVLSIVNL